jgi:hypothetical protein
LAQAHKWLHGRPETPGSIFTRTNFEQIVYPVVDGFTTAAKTIAPSDGVLAVRSALAAHSVGDLFMSGEAVPPYQLAQRLLATQDILLKSDTVVSAGESNEDYFAGLATRSSEEQKLRQFQLEFLRSLDADLVTYYALRQEYGEYRALSLLQSRSQ